MALPRRIPRSPKHSLTLRAVKGQPIYRPRKRRLPQGLAGALNLHLSPRQSYSLGTFKSPKIRRRGFVLEDIPNPRRPSWWYERG